MKRKPSAALFFTAVTVLAWAASAGAVDGTIEINQAKVLATGGFPYVISVSGSYRLTGNLAVSSGVTGISVSANYVTIDLNGFSITGPGGGSHGIVVPFGFGTTVENGTVTAFGNGVVVGDNSVVKSVHADSNIGTGITAGNNAVIEGCTANSNGSNGISCGSECAISGNTANANSGAGIVVLGDSLILHNLLINGNFALFAQDNTTGYGENVLNAITPVLGGTSLGHNLCSGVVC